jgi:hypothetical protein
MKKRKKLAKKILLQFLLGVGVASGLGAKGAYAGRSESVGQKSGGTTLMEEIRNPRKLRHVEPKLSQPKTQNTNLFNPNNSAIQAFLSRSSVVLVNDDTQSENTDSEWEDDAPLPPKQSQLGHQDATTRSLTISQDIKKPEPVSTSKITKTSEPLQPIQLQNNLIASGGKSPIEEVMVNRRKVFEDDDDTLVNPKPNPMPEADAKYEPGKSAFVPGKLDPTRTLPLGKLELDFASRPEKSHNFAPFSDIARASEVAFLARQAIPSLQQKILELNSEHLESFKKHT